MVSWFVTGNYWVFTLHLHEKIYNNDKVNLLKPTHDNASYSISQFLKQTKCIKKNFTNDTSAMTTKSNSTMNNVSVVVNLKKNDTLYITDSVSIKLDLNSICYQTAFFQIISTYSLFLLVILFVISYRLYSLAVSGKKRNTERLNRHRSASYNNHMKYVNTSRKKTSLLNRDEIKKNDLNASKLNNVRLQRSLTFPNI